MSFSRVRVNLCARFTCACPLVVARDRMHTTASSVKTKIYNSTFEGGFEIYPYIDDRIFITKIPLFIRIVFPNVKYESVISV